MALPVLSLASRRPPVAPAEPPTRLTPARQRLAEHCHRQQQQLDLLRDLARPVAEAEAAEKRRAEAKARLDAITELESAALRSWAANPSRAMPAPLSEERHEALSALAVAEHDVEVAQRAADAVQPAARIAEQHLHDLNRQTPALLDAAVIEAATALAERWHQARREQAALAGLLAGLEESLRATGRGDALSAVVEARGQLMGAVRQREQDASVFDANRTTAAGLRVRLADDPGATIEPTTTVAVATPRPAGITAGGGWVRFNGALL